MYRRILVPLDGTRFGDQALPTAVAIASRTGAALELVHVHHHQELDPDLAALPQYRYQHLEEADLQHDDVVRREEAVSLQQRAADLELRYGIRVTARVIAGATAEALWQEAEDITADLIVMSTHARHGFARLWFGSVAQELIEHLNVPALCIHPVSDAAPLVSPQLRRVLVPIDGSEFSEQILDVLVPLLRVLELRPTLLHVITPGAMMVSGMSDVPRFLPHREEARAYLLSLAERFADTMPDPEIIAIEDGEPVETIVGLLQHGGYDMAAMATHGRSGLSRLLLGSVATEVLHRSTRPILLYRPRLQRLPEDELREAFRAHGE